MKRCMRGYIVVALVILVGIMLSSFVPRGETNAIAFDEQEDVEKKAKSVGEIYLQAANEDNSEIFARGTTGTVTVGAVERTTSFFELQGIPEEEAKEKAVDYLLKREAIYQKAIELGYTATDEEIQAYVDQMKEAVSEAENKSGMEEIIAQFPSEEEYWKNLAIQAKKIVPIDKFLHDVEREYIEKEKNPSGRAKRDISMQNGFQGYLDELKEQIMEEQDFEIIK